MNYFLLLAGLALLIGTLLDIGRTTLSPHGAGWLTGRFSELIWKGFKRLSGNNPRRWGLSYAGTFIVGTLLFTWIVLLWTGHTLVYLSDDDAVIHGSTKRPADVLEVIYFVGYNLSTMGNGDFVGATPLWKILASFISFTGLVLITISITYLIPVVQAQIGKQQLSLRIHALGRTPFDLLINTWNGHDFKSMETHLEAPIDPILNQSQQHLVYPVLRYFHASDPQMADTVALATLDETVSLLQTYVPVGQRPDAVVLLALRRALDNYLTTLKAAFVYPDAEPPPPPDLTPLQRHGMPLADNDTTRARFEALAPRRRLLRGMLRADGWSWNDVYQPQAAEEHRGE